MSAQTKTILMAFLAVVMLVVTYSGARRIIDRRLAITCIIVCSIILLSNLLNSI